MIAPPQVTTCMAVVDVSNIGDSRHTMKTPAATIVAAWISALTGVGPAIASGSQTCNGNCADLPTAPQKTRIIATVMVPLSMCSVELFNATKSKVLVLTK